MDSQKLVFVLEMLFDDIFELKPIVNFCLDKLKVHKEFRHKISVILF